MHAEEEECRAERASLLDAHRAQLRYWLAAQVEGHLEFCFHKQKGTDQVRQHAHLGEHRPDYFPRYRVKSFDRAHEQHS